MINDIIILAIYFIAMMVCESWSMYYGSNGKTRLPDPTIFTLASVQILLILDKPTVALAGVTIAIVDYIIIRKKVWKKYINPMLKLKEAGVEVDVEVSKNLPPKTNRKPSIDITVIDEKGEHHVSYPPKEDNTNS